MHSWGRGIAPAPAKHLRAAIDEQRLGLRASRSTVVGLGRRSSVVRPRPSSVLVRLFGPWPHFSFFRRSPVGHMLVSAPRRQSHHLAFKGLGWQHTSSCLRPRGAWVHARRRVFSEVAAISRPPNSLLRGAVNPTSQAPRVSGTSAAGPVLAHHQDWTTYSPKPFLEKPNCLTPNCLTPASRGNGPRKLAPSAWRA